MNEGRELARATMYVVFGHAFVLLIFLSFALALCLVVFLAVSLAVYLFSCLQGCLAVCSCTVLCIKQAALEIEEAKNNNA